VYPNVNLTFLKVEIFIQGNSVAAPCTISEC